MYLMFVDESGDPGMAGSPTRYFALSGLVVHELRWLEALDHLIAFRGRMRKTFGLKLREEIHAAHFITKPGALARIPKPDRLTILRHLADELARFDGMTVINVLVDKNRHAPTQDIFEVAWRTLIQRFENTTGHRNFNGPSNADERGMLFPDGQPSGQLNRLVRRMRRYNPVPSRISGYRDMPLRKVLEDPVYRDSANSLFIQAADLCAFLLYQSQQPNQYMRKSGGKNYFARLDPILCKVAAPADPQGIVRL